MLNQSINHILNQLNNSWLTDWKIAVLQKQIKHTTEINKQTSISKHNPLTYIDGSRPPVRSVPPLTFRQWNWLQAVFTAWHRIAGVKLHHSLNHAWLPEFLPPPPIQMWPPRCPPKLLQLEKPQLTYAIHPYQHFYMSIWGCRRKTMLNQSINLDLSALFKCSYIHTYIHTYYLLTYLLVIFLFWVPIICVWLSSGMPLVTLWYQLYNEISHLVRLQRCRRATVAIHRRTCLPRTLRQPSIKLRRNSLLSPQSPVAVMTTCDKSDFVCGLTDLGHLLGASTWLTNRQTLAEPGSGYTPPHFFKTWVS